MDQGANSKSTPHYWIWYLSTPIYSTKNFQLLATTKSNFACFEFNEFFSLREAVVTKENIFGITSHPIGGPDFYHFWPFPLWSEINWSWLELDKVNSAKLWGVSLSTICYPRCIFILVASLSLLHLYPRCIFILVASLSSLHLYPQCIFICNASLSLFYLFPCCFFFRINLYGRNQL